MAEPTMRWRCTSCILGRHFCDVVDASLNRRCDCICPAHAPDLEFVEGVTPDGTTVVCWRGVSAPGERCYAHKGYDARKEGTTEVKTQTFPKQRRKRDKSHRRYRVHYDLAYEGGGGEWDGFYRTRFGAKLAIFWQMHVSSYGGSADLFDRGGSGVTDAH